MDFKRFVAGTLHGRKKRENEDDKSTNNVTTPAHGVNLASPASCTAAASPAACAVVAPISVNLSKVRLNDALRCGESVTQ